MSFNTEGFFQPMLRLTCLLAVLLCCSSCESDKSDYELSKLSRFSGDWDPVIRVHGFADNEEGCEEVVEALEVKFPKSKYRCERYKGWTISD